MLGRIAAMVALIALAACAGMEPAGRTAQREGHVYEPAPTPPPRTESLPPPAPAAAPPSVSSSALPPPRSMTQSPAPSSSVPPVAAANVAVTAPPPPPPRDPNAVVVHGSVPEEQVRPPNGDPRSISERREDIQNWDHCVMQVMAQQSDPNRPETDTPEDVCSQRLGQSSRNAVPQSRLQRARP
jgi:hypothetical protein